MKFQSIEYKVEEGLPEDFFSTGEVLSKKNTHIRGEKRELTSVLFSNKNPFWHQGRAQIIWMNQKCRVVGFIHPDFKINNKPYATFGYWQTVDDFELNQDMFTCLENWACEHKISLLLGPLNFKTCYDYRLRTNMFDSPPFWGEPMHPQYYAHLLKEMGWLIYKNYVTDTILNLSKIRKIAKARLPKLIADFKMLHYERFSLKAWADIKPGMLDFINKVFMDNTVFQKLNEFDFELLYGDILSKNICIKTSFLIYEKSEKNFESSAKGQLVGFCFNFPDPNRPRRLLVKTIGILPEYRYGGRAFVSCLNRIFESCDDYDEISFCLMSEDNQAHRLTSKYCDSTQTYALFSKSLKDS